MKCCVSRRVDAISLNLLELKMLCCECAFRSGGRNMQTTSRPHRNVQKGCRLAYYDGLLRGEFYAVALYMRWSSCMSSRSRDIYRLGARPALTVSVVCTREWVSDAWFSSLLQRIRLSLLPRPGGVRIRLSPLGRGERGSTSRCVGGFVRRA